MRLQRMLEVESLIDRASFILSDSYVRFLSLLFLSFVNIVSVHQLTQGRIGANCPFSPFQGL